MTRTKWRTLFHRIWHVFSFSCSRAYAIPSCSPSSKNARILFRLANRSPAKSTRHRVRSAEYPPSTRGIVNDSSRHCPANRSWMRAGLTNVVCLVRAIIDATPICNTELCKLLNLSNGRLDTSWRHGFKQAIYQADTCIKMLMIPMYT